MVLITRHTLACISKMQANLCLFLAYNILGSMAKIEFSGDMPPMAFKYELHQVMDGYTKTSLISLSSLVKPELKSNIYDC